VSAYTWPFDAEVLAAPVIVVAYAASQRLWPASAPRRLAFAASQLQLLGAFATPLHTIAVRYLLSAHLLQNVVVAEWAPALAVVGISPALARRVRPHPLVTLPLWLATYFIWHIPAVYDAALRHQHSLLHLEHATYFVAGALLWWPVVHGRWSDGAKALYLFAAFVLASPLGLLLALIPHPIYGFYAHAPSRLWGLGRLTDQQIAGVTMAVEQALVFFAVFVLYLARFLRTEAIAGAWQRGSPSLSSEPWTSSPPSTRAEGPRPSSGR
jgi:cytochrome c oxidase assembly factor CtaG